MNQGEQQQLWVVSELYYPEETSTGHYLTQMAEGLAANRPVRVICGQPTYSARGVRAAKNESRGGVQIHRCWGTTWNKNVLALRVVNLLTLSLSIFINLLVRLRREQLVLVVTNPPLLPFLVSWVCWLRGAKCFLLIHDVYPQSATAAGFLKPNSWITRLLENRVRRLYESVERIIVLGRDMQSLVCQKLRSSHDKVVVIPNWPDLDLVQADPQSGKSLIQSWGLQGKFIVQYSGNMGRTHNLEAVVECASRLRHETGIHFLLAGCGAKKLWVQNALKQQQLENVSFIDPLPRSRLSELLNACDVSIITFVSGMAGVSVPSRMYNILAAGKPIIAMADEDSELAQVVREERVGWTVHPGDVEGFARAICRARDNPAQLAEMALRARRAVEQKYPLAEIVNRYEQLFQQHSLAAACDQRRAA